MEQHKLKLNTNAGKSVSEQQKRFSELDALLADNCNEITDYELLWLILDDKELAQSLLSKYGTFERLCNLSYEALKKEMPENKARLLRLCRSVPHALYGTNKGGIHEKVFTVDKVCDYFMPLFAGATVEKMYLLLIDKAEEVVANILIADGNVETMTVDPKVIISECVSYNAVKAVLAHNHFTGLCPSVSDIETTSKLTWLLGHMGIELVDHIIFYRNYHHSMKNQGEIAALGYSRIFGKY